MYDLIVIGGGPGGYAAADFAAKNGMRVALVERDALGGTCLHRGCVPTKAYLHAAELAAQAAALGMTEPIDRAAMLARKNETVASLADGVARLMKSDRVDVFAGTGKLVAASPLTVSIESDAPQTLQAAHVLLATGSKPARIPVPGCDSPDVWTSDDLLGAAGAEAFASLLIVGGGVIGVEMACVYARLGVAVTILEAEKSCLPMLDRELSRGAETILKSLNVTLLTGARLTEIRPGFNVAYEKDGQTGEVACERVLLSTGRAPMTDALGIPVEMNRRFVAVDERYRTSVPSVYAIGDVNGLCQLAHAAHAQGVVAVADMLGIPAPMDAALIPSCVYTAPEIAAVGLTQDEAKARGLDADAAKALTTSNARTLIEGLGRGFVKLVYERPSGRILGAQLLCGRATDLIGELTLAISRGTTAAELARAVHPHPTYCEAIAEAATAACAKLK